MKLLTVQSHPFPC